MRDLDRWKDKVELSLDGRQLFFLFFGSAVAACLIFVVGVLIGKRLEARALAMQPPTVEDPLAALDQLGDADEAAEGLTYHKALTHEGARAEASHAHAAAPAPAPHPIAAPAPPRAEAAPAAAHAVSAAPAHAVSAAPAPHLPTPPRADAEVDVAASLADAESPAPHADVAPAHVAAVAHPAPHAEVVAARPPVSGHFTLQLSAFPERSDAEEFMHKIQSAGYKPFLVASEIPGKGTFYRVRVGDYVSKQAAADAKTDFERKQRIIAYVAKL